MSFRPRSWFWGAVLGLVGGFLAICIFRGEKTALPVFLPKDNPKELYTIAENQILAFRRNDFSTAYSFAAAGIHEKFPIEQFTQMVRQTYPHLTHAGRLNFGETKFAANVRASAMIYVSNGRQSVPMIYAFIKEQGKWKIEGVQMLRDERQDFSTGDPRT